MNIKEVKKFVESKFNEDYRRCEVTRSFSPQLMILHCEEAAKLALRIGSAEKAALKVLETAAWLHDIAAYEEVPSGQRSEVLSAETAKRFLVESGCSSDFVESVVDTVLACGWDPVKKPITIEQKVLADADFLHHIGPTGFVTTIAYYLSQGKNIETTTQIMQQSIAGWKIYTETGKMIFKARQRFVQSFARFMKEETNQIL